MDLETGLAGYLLVVFGYLLAFVVVVRILSEQRTVGGAWAWLLAMAGAPHFAVPLYLVFGGRKLRFVMHRQLLVALRLQPAAEAPPRFAAMASSLCRGGAAPAMRARSVRLIDDGVEAFDRVMELIHGAERTIDISIFILGRDETGRALVDALAKRAREGVQVRLLLDALGSLRTRGRFCQPLRDAGGEVAVFLPLLPIRPRWSANLRNHRKILVVDSEVGLIGGMNLGVEYMGALPDESRWLDLMVELTGGVLSPIQHVFESDWRVATGHSATVPPAGDQGGEGVLTQVVPDGPDQLNRPFHKAMLGAIRLAEEEVTLVTPYFVPDPGLLGALIAAADTGVRVRLLMPRRSNHLTADIAGRPALRTLLAHGVEVTACDHMVHAKCGVIDGDLGWVASSNLDMRSMALNFEIAALFYDTGVAGELLDYHARLSRGCSRLHLDDLVPRGPLGAFIERVLQLFSPLL